MIGSLVARLNVVCPMVACCAAGQEAALKVEICDLAQNPKDYAGKMVRVRGQVNSGWTKPGKATGKFTIKQPFSSIRCVAQLVVVLPDKVRPKPDFEVRRDEAFEEFEKALRTSMTIEATFLGQFQSAATGKQSGAARRAVLTLVLDRVSDVDAHVLYNK